MVKGLNLKCKFNIAYLSMLRIVVDWQTFLSVFPEYILAMNSLRSVEE